MMSLIRFVRPLLLAALLGPGLIRLSAQSVGDADAAALLNDLPPAPASFSEMVQRVYPNGATTPQTGQFYQTWLSQLEAAQQQMQTLSVDFYRQYPTGMKPSAAPPANRVSPDQQAAMNAATAELAQKMQNDPAFAREFARMTEAEQQAYITKLLAQKGIQPAQGVANTSSAMPAGLDTDWAGMCTTFMQTSADPNRWTALTELRQRFAERHTEVDARANAEVDKLPMVSFGEYGHDHDPEKVKAIRQEAARKHAELGEAEWKEAQTLLAQYRREAMARMTPLNEALKKVNYGKNCDFGIHYTLVLSARQFMLQDLYSLLTNEIEQMETCAAWENQRHQTP